MTAIDRQILITQRRLWFNRWLACFSRCSASAAAAFAIVVVVQRCFDLAMPLVWIAACLTAAALAGSAIWTAIGREDTAQAAVRLDEAAGLRERLSTAHHFQQSADPFARAVVADAERVSGALSARRHIPLVAPQALWLTALSFLVACLTFLLPLGLLAGSDVVEAHEQASELAQTKVAVKRRMDEVRKMVEATPAIEEMMDKLDGADKSAGGILQRPGDVRHEAVKKIDRLADAVKQKRRAGDYDAVRQMRKMFRGLKVPKSSDAPNRKVARALAKGDFKTAREEIEALREQLATLKSQDDRELATQMGQQLSDLAKQLEKLAKNDQLARKLQQAGLSKEDVKRLLASLKKKDLDQITKALEGKKLSPEQIQKLAKAIKDGQKAGALAQKLAQAMKQGGMGGDPGQMGEAMAGLSMAADQLSQLEQLEQEMAQLDSMMAELQAAKDGMGRPCSSCSGAGCSRCKGGGSGSGQGKLGEGRGGLASEQQTGIDFRTRRGKVHTGRGAIIGQFLFDGEQVKGEVSPGFAKTVAAAEHDASDRINRNRIPRQYHKAVKTYFSNVQRSIKSATVPETDSDASGESSEQPADDGTQGS